MLGPFFSKDGSGGYGETAFFHKVIGPEKPMWVEVLREFLVVLDAVAALDRPMLVRGRGGWGGGCGLCPPASPKGASCSNAAVDDFVRMSYCEWDLY